MGKEIERKFLLTKEQAQQLDEMEESTLLSTHEINQTYLKKDKSVVINIVGGHEPKWVVSKDKLSIAIPMPIEDHESLVALLGSSVGGDVSLIPESASRVRFKLDVDTDELMVIFTYKLPGDDFAHEFEYGIEDIQTATSIVEHIPELVSKYRKTYLLDDHKYEVDILMAFNFILLEVEFETIEEASSYELKCDYECEVTGHRAYSNDSLAETIGRDIRKLAI